MRQKQEKEYALVTGANAGIGKNMAYELAKRGFCLVLTAQNEERLKEVAEDLRLQFDVEVHTISLDLSIEDNRMQLYKFCISERLKVVALVNNAGYGMYGYFEQLPYKEQQKMMHLNVEAMVHLCHLFIPIFKQYGKGYILNVGSTAAYQGMATMAVYAASKAFVRIFSRGLRQELKKENIAVSSLMPGPTSTGFIKRASMEVMERKAEKFMMPPEKVAEKAIKGMFNGKVEIVPGMLNKLHSMLCKAFPIGLLDKKLAKEYKGQLRET